ncbi:MAG: Rne/Rng family ribonuclease, partial [Pseudomonadales bacterium]|nr:Rne/Rng family ribonuclease [Pseudomonadales bacterium]
MSEEILINVTPMETRVALIENGLLQEIFIERPGSRGHVGDIFLGRVVRVMPGMEAAFVDIGLERAAFIHNTDVTPIGPDGFEVRDDSAAPVQQLLRDGQSIVVQVAKDAISSKGARLTTHLTLPSRNLVFLPRSRHIGISQRLEDEQERERLLTLLNSCLEEEGVAEQGGYIIRTAAEGADAESLKSDIHFLHRLWDAVKRRIQRGGEVTTLYRDVPVYMRTMRDLITSSVEKIRVDNEESYLEITRFMEEFIPDTAAVVELYRGDRPIFDVYGVEDEINRALSRKVKLKSGGDLVIDQTEAMTTIDVNTGGYLGSRNHAETVLKTNLEAANAIARQLRVRN